MVLYHHRLLLLSPRIIYGVRTFGTHSETDSHRVVRIPSSYCCVRVQKALHCIDRHTGTYIYVRSCWFEKGAEPTNCSFLFRTAVRRSCFFFFCCCTDFLALGAFISTYSLANRYERGLMPSFMSTRIFFCSMHASDSCLPLLFSAIKMTCVVGDYA